MSSTTTTWRGISIRIGIALLAFAVAITAFETGVGVSGQPGVPEAGFLTKVYYALGLFVLGGLDLGVPDSGPLWGRAMLWVAYFGCPAIATAVIAEGLGRLLRAQTGGLGDLRDHTVVVGESELADLFIESSLDADAEDHDLLSVHAEASSQLSAETETSDGLKRINTDLTSPRFADEANLHEARRILLLTDDDVVNLETSLYLEDDLAIDASKLVAHLSDIALKRDIEERGVMPEEMEIFNSHTIAAEDLLDEKIGTFVQSTDYSDEIILAGFGRFGQSMLERLDREKPGEFQSVVLLDRDAGFKYRQFDEQVDPAGDYEVETIDGNMRDPEHWERVTEYLSETTKEPIVVLGADDDATNLQVALWLQEKLPDALLFVRSVGITHLAEKMAERDKFQIENVHERMRAYMKEWSS